MQSRENIKNEIKDYHQSQTIKTAREYIDREFTSLEGLFINLNKHAVNKHDIDLSYERESIERQLSNLEVVIQPYLLTDKNDSGNYSEEESKFHKDLMGKLEKLGIIRAELMEMKIKPKPKPPQTSSTSTINKRMSDAEFNARVEIKIANERDPEDDFDFDKVIRKQKDTISDYGYTDDEDEPYFDDFSFDNFNLDDEADFDHENFSDEANEAEKSPRLKH